MDMEARAHSEHPEALRLWLRMLTCTQLVEKQVRTRLRERFDTTLPRFDLMAQLERAPEGLKRFIAVKGSVALDGVSLTVNSIEGARFGVNIIPYTLAHTTWQDRRPDDLVNLEVDLLARYVARLREQEGR